MSEELKFYFQNKENKLEIRILGEFKKKYTSSITITKCTFFKYSQRKNYDKHVL